MKMIIKMKMMMMFIMMKIKKKKIKEMKMTQDDNEKPAQKYRTILPLALSGTPLTFPFRGTRPALTPTKWHRYGRWRHPRKLIRLTHLGYSWLIFIHLQRLLIHSHVTVTHASFSFIHIDYLWVIHSHVTVTYTSFKFIRNDYPWLIYFAHSWLTPLHYFD